MGSQQRSAGERFRRFGADGTPTAVDAGVDGRRRTALEKKNEQERLINQAKNALIYSVLPAYQSLINLLEKQMVNSTEDDGVWKWPNGDKFYSNALKRTTTTDMTIEEIHQLGLSEVERIHKEMVIIKDKVGFKGSLKSFFNELKHNEKYYYPQSENSIIWDDRNLNINWPLDKTEIQLSKKDIDGKPWKQISFFEKKMWEN